MAPVTRSPSLDDLEAAINNQAEVFKSSAAAPSQIIMRLLKAYEQRFDVLEKNYAAAKQELAEVRLQAANAAVERAEQLAQIEQAVDVERAKSNADKHDVDHQLDEFRSTISQFQNRVTHEIKSQRDGILKFLNDKLTEVQSSFVNQGANTPNSPGFDTGDNDNPMGEDPDDDVPPVNEEGIVNGAVPANAAIHPLPVGASNNESDAAVVDAATATAAAPAAADDDDVVMVEGTWRLRDQPFTDGDEDKAAVLQLLEQRKSPRSKNAQARFATDCVGVIHYRGNNYDESLLLYGDRPSSTPTVGGSAEGEIDLSSQDTIPQRQSTVATDDSEYIPDDSVSATPELRGFRPSPIHRPASDPTTLDTVSTSPTLRNVVIEPTPSPIHQSSDEQRLYSPSAIPVTSQERQQYSSAHRQFGNPRTQNLDSYVRFRRFESNHNGPDSRKRKGEEPLFVSDTETPPQRQRQPPPPPNNAATSTVTPRTPSGPKPRRPTTLSFRHPPAPKQTNSLADATGNAQRNPKQSRSKSTSAATAAPVLATMQTPQPPAQCSFTGFWPDSPNIQSSLASPSNRAQGAPTAPMFVDQDSADEGSREMLERFRASKRRDSAPSNKSKRP